MISFIIPFHSDEPERIRSFKLVHDSLVEQWPDDEVVVADWPWEGRPYDRAKARNRGALYASGDILVFVDADSYVSKSQMVRAIAGIGLNAWALPYTLYYSLSEMGTERFYKEMKAGPEDCQWVFPGPDPHDRPPAVGGSVVVSRAAFEEVHGYDERFIDWGWEDTSFATALETLCGPVTRIPGPLFHLWHPSIQTDQFAHPHLEHNRALHNRYLQAAHNMEKMRALVAEH